MLIVFLYPSFLQNKSPVTFEINETQGIQEQCDEMFVVANVEEVVSDNCVTEEDQSCQSSNVFLVSSVNSDCAESDEDIEVDIDGSDSEGDDNSLIPGNNNILKKINHADTSKGPVVFTYNAHFYARDINFV